MKAAELALQMSEDMNGIIIIRDHAKVTAYGGDQRRSHRFRG